jgi:hypothetical protein
MPHGRPDPFLVALRGALAGEKGKPPAIPQGLQKTTFNHGFALAMAAFGQDPQGPGRSLGLAFLTMQRQVGHCSAGGEVKGWGHIALRAEPFPNSHLRHDLAAAIPGLYLALKNNDPEFLAAILEWNMGEMAMYNLCSTPWNTVALTGARCYVNDGVDQRSGASEWRLYVHGGAAKIHAIQNPVFATSDDELGLFTATLLDKAHADGQGWTAQWPAIMAKLAAAGEKDLPPLLDPIEIERGPGGFVARQTGLSAQIQPSLWAAVDFHSRVESYGCKPQSEWPLGYMPKLGEIPAPAFPGGQGKVYTTPKAPGIESGVTKPHPPPAN